MSYVPDYLSSPPPEAPRRSPLPTLVAWIVILGCVALIVVAGLRPRPSEADATDADPRNVSTTDLLIESRLALGFHELFRQSAIDASTRPAAASPAAGLLASIRQSARRSPVARVRAVPVIAEIAGVDAALAELDELSSTSQELPAALHEDVEALRTVYSDGPGGLERAKRDELAARHGWFARLALTYGSPDFDPDRKAVLAAAVRAAWTGVAMFALAGIGFLAGLVLLAFAVVRFAGGRLRFAYVPPPPGRDGPFVEAFAVYLLCTIAMSVVIAAVNGGPDLPLAANFWLAAALPPAVLWLRLRGLSWSEVRAGLGWHRGPAGGFFREIGCGIAGYVAAIPLLAVAIVVTSILARVSDQTPSHPIVDEAAGDGGSRLALQLYVLAAVYAPIIEETMFRGALYHHVRRRLHWFVAALLVGVLFAAIHPQGWVGIPMLTTIALMLAFLREWRGSILAPVVAHACVNGVTVTMLVMMAG